MATRYIVHGIDQSTGQNVKKLIEAASATEAEGIAARIGMQVSGSEIDTAESTQTSNAAKAGEEKPEWKGNPSQWLNSPIYAGCAIAFLLPLVAFAIPFTLPFALFFFAAWLALPYGAYAFLKVKTTRYELTNQRIRITTGIVAQTIEEVELYRVLDTSVEQAVIDRILKIGTITVTSSDKRQPVLLLHKIPAARDVREKLRALSEERRRFRKVQEIELQ
jgi:membrane protein YdbS with pleckstrin-like domain